MELFVACEALSIPSFVSIPFEADIRMPSIFGDHMVLQTACAIPIWGIAPPGELVSVHLGQRIKQSVCANEEGTWEIRLPSQPVSVEPLELRVECRGCAEVKFEDVLVGEVWLCAGQSNMEQPVWQCMELDDLILPDVDRIIRHIKVASSASASRERDFRGRWQVVSRSAVAGWTGLGTSLASHLWQDLGIPIGIVNCSLGDTRIEAWCAPSALAASRSCSSLETKPNPTKACPGALYNAWCVL